MAGLGGGVYADRDSPVPGFSLHLYSVFPFLTRVVPFLYIFLYIIVPYDMGGGGKKMEHVEERKGIDCFYKV